MGPLEMDLIAARTLSAIARQSGVDHQDAVLAHLHGDVAARADDHIDVALHRPDMDFES